MNESNYTAFDHDSQSTGPHTPENITSTGFDISKLKIPLNDGLGFFLPYFPKI